MNRDESMFHKVKRVTPQPDFRILVRFAEGETKVYDLSPFVEAGEVFSVFRAKPELFEDVEVDIGGYGVVWDDDLDLSAEELWENGVEVKTPFNGLLSFADATKLWDLNESTLRKAVAHGKLRDGIDACNFGSQWVVTSEAMHREYGKPKRTAA